MTRNYKKTNICATCNNQFICKSGTQKYCSDECAGNPIPGNDTVYIYSLSDPRTGEVRYVGKTIVSVTMRLRQHLSMIHDYPNCSAMQPPVRGWLYELWESGLKPQTAVIELCTRENWADRESFWINHFRNLLNRNSVLKEAVRIGRDWRLDRASVEAFAAVPPAKRGGKGEK